MFWFCFLSNSIKKKRNERETALKKASLNGHKEVVESLLSAGADLNLQNQVCDIDDCCDE